MIRLEHTRLPRGLNALVLPHHDDVVITVSAALPSELKKASVLAAMAAAKRAGWRRTRMLPPAVWIPLAAAAIWEVLRRLVAEAGPAHAAAAAGAVVTVAAVGVTTLVVLVPNKPGPVTIRQIPPIAQTHPKRRAPRIATIKRQPKRGKGPSWDVVPVVRIRSGRDECASGVTVGLGLRVCLGLRAAAAGADILAEQAGVLHLHPRRLPVGAS